MQWQQLLRRQAAARLLPASWAVLVQVTGEVLALLQERQDRRKAKLLAHRRDVHFTVREEVLLHTEHTPLPSQLLLSQAGMGPLKVLAFTASTPTACTSFPQWPSRPSLWRGRRAGARGGRAAQMRYYRPHVLVQWTGSDASGDTLEPLESMTNCRRPLPLSNAQPAAPYLNLHSACRCPPPTTTSFPRQGYSGTVDAAPPSILGAALVGLQLLYWWQDDGWQRCTVARLCQRPAFSHVVAAGGLHPADSDVGAARHG
jgi:hypothetical protein